MQKKRILFFLPFMNGGGAERVVLSLLGHLDREQYIPVLVLLRQEGRYLSLIPSDVEVIDLEAKQARYAILKIIQVIHIQKPDIVFTTLAYLNLYIAMIRPFFPRKMRFIARESNTVSIRNKREKYPRIFDWLYKNIYKNFDLIVTQAEFMRDDLVKNYGIERERMVVIYNPVDSDDVQKKALEQEGVDYQDGFNLLAVGKLGYQKGFDMLLSIMRRLPHNYKLTILGEGSDKTALQNQIKEFGLQTRVRLLGFCDNPYAYMAKADLFVLSSRYEGLPNVVLEANALGLPVVAFDSAGGTGEIIREGENGFLVSPFDEKAFAQMIEKASSFAFDREAIQDRTRADYHVQKVVKLYEQLFSE